MFLRLLQRPGRLHRDCNTIYQFLWEFVHSYQDLSNLQQWQQWFTAKLRQLRQAKEDAYKKGDNVLYKQAKYTLEKKIKVAKRNYSGKLRNKFSYSDSASEWKCLKDITNYKKPSPQHCGESEWVLLQVWKKHHSHLLQTPLSPHLHWNKWRWRAPGLQKEQEKEGTRPRRYVTSLSKILCWPTGPHLHTDLQHITGAVRSPLMLQTLHNHPRPKETQNYWT